MTNSDIARRRLHSQHINQTVFKQPREVVQWLGAVQAQDYAGAKWALAMRAQGLTDADVDRALADGTILRTHILRPTWHFVTPADIRWMLKLTAPRVNAVNAHMYRKLELDDAIFKRSNTALARGLRGGRQLTRAELASQLERTGIAAGDSMRLGYLIHRAELDGIVCSGARRGKQFTYALLDERAPGAGTFNRDEAMAELSKRYFTSRGPATVKDFVWWSGLTMADAKAGIEMAGPQLHSEVIGGQTYWFSDNPPATRDTSPAAYLLSTYDEHLIGYKDRGASVEAAHAERILSGAVFTSTILLRGQVAGVWKRTIAKNKVVIETNLFRPLTKAEKQAVAAAARQYGVFLDMPVELASSIT
ncbi:MAG: winged helix DNA-binding domain-containing protein [Blastocatellia bacterium]